MVKILLYRASLILILFFISTNPSFSQTLSTDPDPVLQLAPSEIVLPGEVCGDITIKQSTSQTITPGNSVSCINTDTGIVRENSFYRAFDLDTFELNTGLEICQVQIGIERATAGFGGQQPATVNLYTSDPAFPGDFPDSLTLIGTTGVIQIADQALTILTIPVTGTAPLGSELVVELFIPDGLAAGNEFFVGSNAFEQTGPSYLRAPVCGVPNPSTTEDLGFPSMHIVMNVIGDELAPIRNIPTLSEWGLIAMAGVLGIIGLLAVKRRKATS